jgi:hypothetical protein
MARRSEVNANLMRAAGIDRDLDEGFLLPMLDEANAAPCSLSRSARRMHRSENGMGHEANGMLESCLALGEESRHDTSIPSLDVLFPGSSESAPCVGAHREEHDSGGSASETMKGRCGRVSAAHAREKRVLEEDSAGDRGKAGGFRDSENGVVFVEDGEARGNEGLPPRWPVPDEGFSRRELPIHAGGDAVHEHESLFDSRPPLERRRVAIPLAQIAQEGPAACGFGKPLAVSIAPVERFAQGFRPMT